MAAGAAMGAGAVAGLLLVGAGAGPRCGGNSLWPGPLFAGRGSSSSTCLQRVAPGHSQLPDPSF